METPSPGWYPDPLRRYDLRYHNGSTWTADVSAAGQRHIDPFGLQPVAGAAPPAPPAGPRRRNGIGIAAMVLGIIAAATAWLPFVFVGGAICGVLAFIFGLVARRRRVTHGPSQAGTIGLVLGPIAIVLAVGGFVLTKVVLDVVRPGEYEIVATACTHVGDRQLFEGTIHNESGRERSYTIHVEFLRQGTRNVLERASTDVLDVPEGSSAPFTVSVRYPGTEVDCRVDTVTGALDFLD
jgi:uncharacterized protein DUF2510